MNIEIKSLSSDDTRNTCQKSIISNGELEELQRQIGELDSRLKKLEDLSSLASLSYGGLRLQVPERCCTNCMYIEEGMMYMSNPPKFKCLLHQTWYDWSEMNSRSCDNWEKKE